VGEGPTGIVLDETNQRAYVLNKFDGSISTLDLDTEREVARTTFFDPTP
jgi:DNA-binding beta-propeller fold protein YncE